MWPANIFSADLGLLSKQLTITHVDSCASQGTSITALPQNMTHRRVQYKDDLTKGAHKDCNVGSSISR